MMLRAFLADVLAELVPAQEVDEGRPAEDRDDHRDERRYENPGHYAVRFSATTASPTPSDPFTSTASPGRRPAPGSGRSSWRSLEKATSSDSGSGTSRHSATAIAVRVFSSWCFDV